MMAMKDLPASSDTRLDCWRKHALICPDDPGRGSWLVKKLVKKTSQYGCTVCMRAKVPGAWGMCTIHATRKTPMQLCRIRSHGRCVAHIQALRGVGGSEFGIPDAAVFHHVLMETLMGVT